jgi:uncharacterized protein (DUF952 family)
MRPIYHLTTREAWAKAAGKAYRADSLDSEGFIHCSNADQVARSANRFYANAEQLFVLSLDADRLGAALRDEAASNGEIFPHIYGPIEADAVIEVCPLRRGSDGKWKFGS